MVYCLSMLVTYVCVVTSILTCGGRVNLLGKAKPPRVAGGLLVAANSLTHRHRQVRGYLDHAP